MSHDRVPLSPDDFAFELPTAQIAQTPAPRREQARLLVVDDPVRHLRVHELARAIPEGALVVLNDSRVVPARLEATRPADGRTFELLWCAPSPGVAPGDVFSAWVRGAKRLRPEDRLRCGPVEVRLLGTDAVDPRARRFEVVEGDLFAHASQAGEMPLPPYISRPSGPDEEDAVRYQTVYARLPGSVAAPTAGLHFTPELLASVDHAFITLHVGPGTFLPMEAEDVRAHRVGSERFELSASSVNRIERARADGRPIVAVGTTTTRALESVAAAHGGRLVAGEASTDLVISPGFDFKVIDGLWTNFHLPKSSLLMLVCSFGGNARVLSAYREAVSAGYRFYSYGDAMYVPRAGR